MIEAIREWGRMVFPRAVADRVVEGLKAIRGRSCGPGEGAFCIFETVAGYVQFLDQGDEGLVSEIQSPAYRPGMSLTENGIAVIRGCGYRWPEGQQNFWRHFTAADDADLIGVAELALGLLNTVFGLQAMMPLTVTVHQPGTDGAGVVARHRLPKPEDAGSSW